MWDLPKTIVRPSAVWWVGAHHSEAENRYHIRYNTISANPDQRPLLCPHPGLMRWNHYIKMTQPHRNLNFSVPVVDRTAEFYLKEMEVTYENVEGCARGDKMKCEQLKKNNKPVFLKGTGYQANWV